MAFCLPFEKVSAFKQALVDGTIDPDKLSEMSSADRHDFLAGIVGKEDAGDVNALLESKLILKDQQAGMIRWAKAVTNITERERSNIITKIGKLSKVLDPEDQTKYLQDLASQKLGTQVTFDEAKQITALSKQFAEARDSLDPKEPIGSDARIDYGAKKVALENYVKQLKLGNEHPISDAINHVKTGDFEGMLKDANKIGAITKSLKAVGDLSSLFRQGFKTLWTDPGSWATNALKTFGDVGKQLAVKGTDDSIMDAVKADLYSRPNAINGMYDKMKLAIGNDEEAIPTSLPERIPLFGRLFKATQTGFEGFLYRVRADVADKYINMAQKAGVDLNKTELSSIGKMVNSLTGRGYLGRGEELGKALNNVFFSPKFIKSNIDTLTAHQFQEGVTPFVRKQAAINLVKVVGMTSAVLTVAHMLNPKSVDLDARSSNFGKIKVGKIAFDVTGGSGPLVTLAARIIENSTKSTTTGKVTPLNTGKFGSQTSVGVIEDFLTNKESPIASTVSDILNRSTFAGGKPTIQGEAANLVTPFPIQNIWEATPQVGLANSIAAEIADALGLYTTIPTSKK